MLTPRYIVRALKSILYMSILFFLIFFLIYTFSDPIKPGLTFIDFIAVNNWKQMIAFILLFGCVYPLVAFYKKEIWLVKPFAEEKTAIVEIFQTLGYGLSTDNDGVLEFRLRNKFQRMMRLFMEDAVTVNYSQGNPIVIFGMRKDAYRLGRHIEYLNKQSGTDE